jgi:hypothetical protein
MMSLDTRQDRHSALAIDSCSRSRNTCRVMSATCYRCTALKADPGEPFGSCLYCGSFACATCGVRVAGISRFYCVSCKAGVTLLPSGGLPPTGGGGGGGGTPRGGGPAGDRDHEASELAVPYASSAEFEVLEPTLAENTRSDRAYYHGSVEQFLAMPSEYAYNEAVREQIDSVSGYRGYEDEVEQALRSDLRGGAQRLARDLEWASARDLLRPGLIADAFGVAQWATGVRAGQQVPPERLWMLPDQRLRFIVGAAAVAAGPVLA